MCELFALNSNVPTAATFSFAGFSARGGATGPHVDGWGMAFHDADGCRVFIDAGRACDAPLAEFLRRHPLRARTVLAHVRKATQGAVALANCHPFQREWLGRSWLFCHNGDLKGFRPPLHGGHLPVGQTDSEWVFCWLLQELRGCFAAQPAPGWPQIAPALAELVAEVRRHGSFNLLLSDGEALYAHASTRLAWLERQHPFRRVQLVDREIEIDLASANAPGDRMALIATAPLTAGEAWHHFEPGELRVFAGGRSVWQHGALAGTDHQFDLRTASAQARAHGGEGTVRVQTPANA
jgi:glutamine amidotransferase